MSRPAEADQLVLTQCVTHGRGVLAGMGRSASATDGLDAAWSMADFADDAAGLLRALGVATCYVVGWSFGGMVAQHLARAGLLFEQSRQQLLKYIRCRPILVPGRSPSAVAAAGSFLNIVAAV